MTVARRLASRCASLLVKYASPGWKDWAKGLRRETDFIESDWQALKWTLNGMWVLLDYRPAPIRTFEDLTIEAQKFANKQRFKVNDVWFSRNMQWLIWAMPIFSVGLIFLTARSHAKALPGTVLKLAGMLIFLTIGLRSSGEPNVPDRDDIRGTIIFYKLGMGRLCREMPFSLAGSLILGCGYVLPLSGGWERSFSLWTSGFWFVLPILIVWKWRINLQRLRDIERFDLRSLGDL